MNSRVEETVQPPSCNSESEIWLQNSCYIKSNINTNIVYSANKKEPLNYVYLVSLVNKPPQMCNISYKVDLGWVMPEHSSKVFSSSSSAMIVWMH